LSDKIKKNEIGWPHSTYEGEGEMHTGVWWGNLKERNHLEAPGLDRRIILKWIFKK